MAAARAFEITGRHVLALMLGFFGVVIGVNALFITLAMNTFPGEVVPKSYVQGLEYNQVLADRAAQTALGWRAQAEIVRDEVPMLAIRLEDREGRPLAGLSLSGELRRPASADQDTALAFRELGAGRYGAEIAGLAPGIWRLNVLAARGADHLEIGGDVTWTP